MPNKKYYQRTRLRHHAVVENKLPVIVKQPRNCGNIQQSVISVLVNALHGEGVEQVNYDHVFLTVPKAGVPLSYRKHRYDVSCAIGDRVILIDVLSVNLRYWQTEELNGHGEAQEQAIQRNAEPASG